MLDPFDLTPVDIGRNNVFDATLRNRWWRDPDGRLRKARELRVLTRDGLAEIIVPMVWDVEKRTWVEDTAVQRQVYKTINAHIRNMKF